MHRVGRSRTVQLKPGPCAPPATTVAQSPWACLAATSQLAKQAEPSQAFAGETMESNRLRQRRNQTLRPRRTGIHPCPHQRGASALLQQRRPRGEVSWGSGRQEDQAQAPRKREYLHYAVGHDRFTPGACSNTPIPHAQYRANWAAMFSLHALYKCQQYFNKRWLTSVVPNTIAFALIEPLTINSLRLT